MKKICTGALGALVAVAVLAAPAYAGPTVTVRVEGESATLLERTAVTLPDTPPPVSGCDKWTVAAAIDEATHGNWDRQSFTSTILGESHTFTHNDYWAEWLDGGSGYRSGNGICNDVMKNGDEALMLADISSATFAPTRFPLDLEGVPAAIEAGKPVTVTVVAYVTPDGAPGSGTRTPVEGATVTGGGARAVTGADGTAVLSFAQPGAFVVKASRPGNVVSAGERVTVSAAPVLPPPCRTSGTDGLCGTRDAEAPIASFARLADGQVFRHKHGPRKLAGSVTPDPSGLLSVRLSIVRKRGGRCWAFDGATERFKRHRCGGSRSFRIGDRADWSYLLPRRLGKGRYAIRAAAIDKAGNDSSTTVEIRVR
jgi:hypothetical protein